MKMQLNALFPTLIGQGSLPKFSQKNQKLLEDIRTVFKEDKMGRQWSQEHYIGGYTSYASLSDLHHRYPSFAALEEDLQPFGENFGRAQGWDLKNLHLKMTHLWINWMPTHTYHTLHLHPHSAISGTYYVDTPPGSSPLKIEDPRMAFYMSAPLREHRTQASQHYYYEIPAKAGNFVLFESWLRHEFPPNGAKKPRISLSFNYTLTDEA